MKQLLFICLFLGGITYTNAQTIDSTYTKLDPAKKKQQVEIACGQCQFKMKGKGCNLAIRIDGKQTYWVDGPTVDSFGDAHADDGFCNAIRKGEVQGTIKKERFQLTYFKFIDQH